MEEVKKVGAEIPGPGWVKFGIASDPVNQTVLVAGGQSESYTPLKSSLLYDVEKDTWIPLADMEKERSECDAAFLGGKFHVVNVIGSPEMRFPVCAESLDPDTWQWGPGDGRFLCIASRHRAMGDVEGGRRRRLLRSAKAGGNWKRWREVADVPVELMKISCMMTWKGKLAVIGGPFSSQVMQQMPLPEYLKTDKLVYGCGMDF
ncbi:hypothetical protein V2J09_005451 [Rumex salicifolius]